MFDQASPLPDFALLGHSARLRAEPNPGLASFFRLDLSPGLSPSLKARRLREAVFEDRQRVQNRLLLDHQVRQLSQRPTTEIIAMAESFALENCVLRPACYAALRPYLSPRTDAS